MAQTPFEDNKKVRLTEVSKRVWVGAYSQALLPFEANLAGWKLMFELEESSDRGLPS